MIEEKIEYSSMAEMLEIKVEPTQEDYIISVAGKDRCFRIEGVGKYKDRQNIMAEINRFCERPPTVVHNGESFQPDVSDIIAAIWCAGCVTEPKLSAMDWLKFAQSAGVALKSVYIRCLVASREIADPNQKTDSVIDQAKEVLQDDPLEQPSDASASKS